MTLQDQDLREHLKELLDSQIPFIPAWDTQPSRPLLANGQRGASHSDNHNSDNRNTDNFHIKSREELSKVGIYTGLTTAEQAHLQGLGWQINSGKVRQLISKSGQLYILHTDRLTAFDRHIAYVPYKGQLLAELNSWWLQQAAAVVPTHYLGIPHPRLLQVTAAKPFKVEVVVRGYLAGSLQRAYAEGTRKVCGNRLPDGLRAYDPLPGLLITPTTKAAAFEHDVEIAPTEIVKQQICSDQQWQQIENLATQLFKFGSQIYLQHGWILVDTKYEFGQGPNGEVIVIDEIHTPDSSRLWRRATYENARTAGLVPEMFDKEIVREWLLAQGFRGEGAVPRVPSRKLIELALVYLDVTEQLLGQPLRGVGGPSLKYFA